MVRPNGTNDLNVTIPDPNPVISYAMQTQVVLSKTINLFNLIKQLSFLLNVKNWRENYSHILCYHYQQCQILYIVWEKRFNRASNSN